MLNSEGWNIRSIRSIWCGYYFPGTTLRNWQTSIRLFCQIVKVEIIFSQRIFLEGEIADKHSVTEIPDAVSFALSKAKKNKMISIMIPIKTL